MATLEQHIKTANANIETLPEKIGIKSIQRGTANMTTSENSLTITIRPIDPTRSLVLLDTSGGYQSISTTGVYAVGAYIGTLTANQLTIDRATVTQNATNISYQIIEYC